MRSLSLVRLAAATTVVAVTASTTVAPALASDETPSASPPFTNVDPDSVTLEPSLNTTPKQVPALNVSIQQHIHGRKGGRGSLNVELSRRKGDGVEVKDLVIELSGPSGVSVTDAYEYVPLHAHDNGTPDWDCTNTGSGTTQQCSFVGGGGTLAPGEVPDPIRVRASISADFALETARIRASATWTEARVAAGGTGEATDPVDPDSPWRQQAFADSVELAADPSIAVELSSGGGEYVFVHSQGSAEQRRGILAAKIANLRGRDASAQWSQVSGPSVTWLKPTEVSQPASTTSQTYELPSGVPDGTELQFRIDVESNGNRVYDVATVVVRTVDPGVFDPRVDLISQLAASTKSHAQSPRSAATLKRRDYRGRISGDGVKRVQATRSGKKPNGKRHALKKRQLKFVHPVGVRHVAWTTVSGKKSLLKRANHKRKKLVVRVPRQPGTWLIRGTATLKNGRTTSRTKILRVDPAYVKPEKPNKAKKPKKTRTMSSAHSQSTGELPAIPTASSAIDAAPLTLTAPVCSLKKGSVLQFADGSSLKLGSYSPPKNCTAALQQNFTGATFTFNGYQLGSAQGTVSGSTIEITQVTLTLPSSLASMLPAGTPTSFTVTPPAATPVTSTLSGTTWGPWTGSFILPALPFLPTPSGWSAPSGLLSLSSTTSGGKVTGAQLTMTLTTSATTAVPGQGAGGHASFEISLSSAGASTITVTAANLAVFQTTSGDQIEFSGTGTIPLSNAGSASVSVSMNCSAPVSGDCPLTTDFALKNGTAVEWTQGSGITMTGAQARIGRGSGAYTIGLSGTYTSPGSWSLTVTDPGSPWPLGSSGATLSGFSGSLAESTSGNSSSLAVDISATVNNLDIDPELTVSKLSASISNKCAKSAKNCTTADLKVSILVDATGTFLGDDLDFTATASLDLTTMQFDFDATETFTGDIGPSELNITSATITLTNEALTGSCVPSDSGAATAGSALSLGVTAQGSAFGSPLEIGGDVNSDGYCIWAAVGDLASGEFQGSDVLLAYSSYDAGATLTLPSNAGDTAASSPSADAMTVTVPASAIELHGNYTLPAEALNDLGIDQTGDVAFTASVNTDLTLFSASVDFELEEPVFLGGGLPTDSVAIAISSVDLTANYSSSPVSANLTLTVDSEVVVAVQGSPGCPADSSNAPAECSYTPVDGSIGLALDGADVDVTVSLSLGAPTNNAFGEQGLDISTLSISGSFGVGNFSVGVDGAGTLPSSWTEDLAIINDAPVALAFDISDQTPCLQFALGEEESDAIYLDIANAGVLTASYIALTIAPNGCEVSTGAFVQQVAPGYSFAFDGSILGDNLAMNINATFDPTVIDATLNLGAFNLGGVVAVDDTTATLNWNSGNGDFSLGFSTGFTLGDPSFIGGEIQLNGDIISTGAGNFTLVLGGNAGVNVADIASGGVWSADNTCPSWTTTLPEPPNNCLIAYQETNGSVSNFDISANMWMDVIGVTIAGEMDLIYADGNLMDFHLGLGASFSASVDGYDVASVSGTFFIDYCQGTLNPPPGNPTSGSSCDVGGSEVVYSIYLAGSWEALDGWIGPHGYSDLVTWGTVNV